MENRKIYNYFNGSNIKIEELVNDYTNYIKTIIRNSHINLSEEDNEEIILDVFLTFWKNKEVLDINKNISPYIAGITNNLLKKKCRDIKVNYNIEDFENEIFNITDNEMELFESEENKEILEFLKQIKKEDKEIFLSYYYENRKIKEISKIYNMSEEKIKSKLFRIRKKLKKFLEKKGGYYE